MCVCVSLSLSLSLFGMGMLCGDDPATQNLFLFGMGSVNLRNLWALPGRYHLYIGYDAGVYGYGWSDVYAADLFHTMQAGW